jgi:hypothetical protein
MRCAGGDAMTSVPSAAVLLLHDQMFDARVWHDFADLVRTHARVVTVDLAPLPQLNGRPSVWADHIGDGARKVLTAPVTVTVGAG